MKKTIFYSHPMSLYDTPQEERDINLLVAMGFDVINPNGENHEEEYESKGEEYFLDLVRKCDGVAFRGFPCGKIPAGVASEAIVADCMDKILFELPGPIRPRALDVHETREWLKASGQR